MGAFPEGKSALMLASARLPHVAGTKWGTRRYLDVNRLKCRREGCNLLASQSGRRSGVLCFGSMRISFIGHASILVESKNISILSDPWWAGPCFGAQWWIHPKPFIEVLEKSKPEYIYLSHGHSDHLHPGTLARFDRNTKILVARDLDIGPGLRKLGFTVLELPDGEPVELGSGVRATIRPTINDDSLLVVTDGKETCVNLNDALHATPLAVQDRFIAWLRKAHPSIDYLFCGYGTASHFPNCYRIPGKDYERTAARRQHHFNSVWARIVQELKPKYAFPFAADVLLLEEDLFWTNEPVHNAERPVHLLNGSGVPNDTQAIDLAPGFVIDAGEIKSRVLRSPIRREEIAEQYKAQIEKANYCAEVAPAEISAILPLLQNNLRVCEDYLTAFPGNYSVLLRFRNSEKGIVVAKAGQKLTAQTVSAEAAASGSFDLLFTTRLAYLKRSLESQHGNEIMFVGSGCLFDFPNAEMVSRGIHAEVRHIVRYHNSCPPPRYGNASPFIHKSKELVKRALGLQETDLYDLEKWTLFSER